MSIKIDPALFRFELEQLFASRQGWYLMALVQFVLWMSAHKSSAGLYVGLPDYWSNYILINGFCQSLILNLLVAGELLIKPKNEKTIEMMLASGVSLQTIAATNVAVCASYNAFSLLLAFWILGHFTIKPSFTAVHALSFLVVMALNLVTLVCAGFIALQTRYGSRLSGFFLLLSVAVSIAAAVFGFSLNTSPSFQFGLLFAACILAGLSLLLFRKLDREKVILS
ncbi:MAG: hypothetical protein A2081_02790 [Elusimicrobia bacterium GWC2_61_19]|nr:MAG: hypothetical protein A2081_02790 [Elusimicrobia bacterium GWC2_61_19]